MPEEPRRLESTGQGTRGESRADSTAEASRAARASPAKDWSAQAWRKLPERERSPLRSTESTRPHMGQEQVTPRAENLRIHGHRPVQLWVELCLLESPMLRA